MTAMSQAIRRLHLGLMFWATGTHAAGWRLPDAREDAAFDIEFLQHVTQVAERARFDFLFLGDRLATDPRLQRTNPAQMSRLEPFTTAASLAAATSRIGIVVTANPTYYDPYSVARLMGSLDHVSAGRASWNIVTGADDIAAANFSRTEHWETGKRYDWADEFVDVVKALWDGAPSVEAPAGVPLDHDGRHFRIAGPLDVPRLPQRHAVILHAGTSDRSRELGAREADVIFAGQPDIPSAQAYYADIKQRAARYGRGEDEIAILPGLTPIVAPTTEEAVAIYDRLNAFLPLDPEEAAGEVRKGGLGRGRRRNLSALSETLGVDVRGNDPGAVVEPALYGQASEAGRRLIDETARRTRRSLTGAARISYRDLIDTAGAMGAIVVGNPEEVADFIQAWFDQRAADGFNIFPAYVPGAVEAFAELVVPVLQRRGLFRLDYEGPTFRDHLGLGLPGSRRDRDQLVRL